MNLSFNRQRTNSTIKCILVTHIFRRMYFSIHYVGFKIPFHVIFRRSRAPINGRTYTIVSDADRACLFWESTVHLRVHRGQTIRFLQNVPVSPTIHTYYAILSTSLRFFCEPFEKQQ